MQEIPPIEVLPEIKTLKCKLLVYLIHFSLSYLPIILGTIIGYYYSDVFIGFTSFIAFMLASGIVGSKLSDEAIPLSQREFEYSNLDIAKWFVIRVLICEINKG